jgi:hypothetical protein
MPCRVPSDRAWVKEKKMRKDGKVLTPGGNSGVIHNK